MRRISYRSALLAELRKARFADYDDNYDYIELGEEPPPKPGVLRECVALSRQRRQEAKDVGGWVSGLRPLARAAAFYLAPDAYFTRYAAEEIARGDYLYDLLADEPSRALLVKLIAYRILGHRKVKLPRNTSIYWSSIERMSQYRTADPPLPIKFMDARLYVHDMRPLGYEMSCHATGTGLAYTLVQKQYEYHHADVHCKAEAGDVVVDAGACWGETSHYFAHEAGSAGAVLAFEFIPSNLAVLKRNQALNPHLAGHLHVIERPVWRETGQELYYVDWGPGSRVTSDINQHPSWEGKVQTITIDDVLAQKGLDRVNFIKMDIEGAELPALQGAETAIRKHRPKLAISVYHRPDDFQAIPRYLESLDLDYRYYLDHHTLYQNETVLFAVPN